MSKEYTGRMLNALFPQIPMMKEYGELLEELNDYKADREALHKLIEYVELTAPMIEECIGILNNHAVSDDEKTDIVLEKLLEVYDKFENAHRDL